MNAPRATADDQRLLELLKGSPIMKDALSAETARIAARRKELVGTLSAQNAKAEREWPVYTAATEKAIKELRAAESAVRAASAKAFQAQNARSDASSQHTRVVDEIEAELRRTSHPEIALFKTDMLNELERTRRIDGRTLGTVSINPVTGARKVTGDNGAARRSILARIDGIREAIVTADAMQLEADQSKVSERLYELRLSLPAVVGA
jgi:hypothetical protein